MDGPKGTIIEISIEKQLYNAGWFSKWIPIIVSFYSTVYVGI